MVELPLTLLMNPTWPAGVEEPGPLVSLTMAPQFVEASPSIAEGEQLIEIEEFRFVAVRAKEAELGVITPSPA
jgi:hypothetical protein